MKVESPTSIEQKQRGALHEPTILSNVNHEMDVMREETFGPVLPLMVFKSEDEAARLATNDHALSQAEKARVGR